MSLLHIIDGDYGQIVKLTMIDVDTDAAADVSAYTTSQLMIFTAVEPDGATTSKTAAFDTDGSDGVIKYTTEDGFLTTGKWRVRARVTSGTAVLTSVWHTFDVLV